MIKSDEFEIIGNWVEVGGGMVRDDACERVTALTENYLKKVGYSPENGGWNTLYIDPHDGRYLERVYLRNNLHGGGPPSLVNLSEDDAKNKYSQLFVQIGCNEIITNRDI